MSEFYVESMYGAKTKQGIVKVTWDGKEIQLTILDAKKIAYTILECCEAAATDAALVEFLGGQLGMSQMQCAAALQILRQQRPKQDPHFFED